MTSCTWSIAFTCYTEKAERQDYLNGWNACLLFQGHSTEQVTKPKPGKK